MLKKPEVIQEKIKKQQFYNYKKNITSGIDAVLELVKQIGRDIEENPLVAFKPNSGYQEQFLQCPKRFRVIFAGNRSGKSFINAYEVCRFALGQHSVKKIDVPNIGWVVSPDMKLATSIMLPYIRKFLGNNVKAYWKREAVLQLKNGSEIHFKSVDSSIQKFTGVSIRYCAIDEDCSEEVFKEAFMRTIDQQGDLWFTITPLYSSWVYEKIWLRQFTDPELEIFVGSIYENKDHISPQEIIRMKSIYSPEEFEARVYGKFMFLSGLIYKEFDKRKHVIQPFRIPKDWIRVRFIDSGINDPTCCLWVAINPDNEYFIYREYYETDKIIDENVKNILELTGDEKISYTWIDPATDKRSTQTRITDYRAYINAGLKPLLKAPVIHVGTRIDKVKGYLLRGQIKIFNTCLNTIKEFSTWRFKRSGMPDDRNNHALDCISYLCCIEPKYSSLLHPISKTLSSDLSNAQYLR